MSSIITFTYCSKWNHLLWITLVGVQDGVFVQVPRSSITLSNLSSLNLVTIFRCPTRPLNPVYVWDVWIPQFWLLVSLLHRHPCKCISFSLSINNKQRKVSGRVKHDCGPFTLNCFHEQRKKEERSWTLVKTGTVRDSSHVRTTYRDRMDDEWEPLVIASAASLT